MVRPILCSSSRTNRDDLRPAKKAIPDAIEGISVYYIEGKPH